MAAFLKTPRVCGLSFWVRYSFSTDNSRSLSGIIRHCTISLKITSSTCSTVGQEVVAIEVSRGFEKFQRARVWIGRRRLVGEALGGA